MNDVKGCPWDLDGCFDKIGGRGTDVDNRCQGCSFPVKGIVSCLIIDNRRIIHIIVS